MKSPPSDGTGTRGAPTDRVDTPSAVVRAGRLVTLLTGEGLNSSTIEELLRPESFEALEAVLTHHPYPESDGPADDGAEEP